MADTKPADSNAKVPAPDANAAPASEKPGRRLDPRIQMIIDHVWGPTGSMIIHIILLILLVNIVMGPAAETKVEVVAQVVDPKEMKLDEPEKKLEEIKDVQPENPDLTAPAMEQPQEVASVTSDPDSTDIADLDIRTDVMGPIVMKDLFRGRSADGRAKAAGAYNRGDGGRTEIAVMKALRWLKDHQQSEGYWGTGEGTGGHRVAMTGIALLAFLAHGETPNSKEFGATVEKAIKWLSGEQKEGGEFLPIGAGNPAAYENGIAVYAMSEAYAMTRIPELRGVMEKGVECVIRGQQDTGAFTYEYAKNGRRDTSVTGWQAQAMKAAFIAGAENSGLKDAMEKTIKAFKMNYQADSGKFMYAPEGGNNSHTTLTCTGIGVLGIQLLGQPAAPEVEGGMRALSPVRVVWGEAKDAGIGEWPIYGWYYITQTKYHKSPQEWESWRGQFYKVMLEKQNEDGSWTPLAGSEKGNGRVYGTAFTALSLMVYYRYLPTYKQLHTEEEKPAGGGKGAKDDVVVEIG